MPSGGGIAVIAEYKVVAIASRNDFILVFVLANIRRNGSCCVHPAENDIPAVGKGYHIVSALVFRHRAGNARAAANTVGLPVGFGILVLARRIVGTACIPFFIFLINAGCTGPVVTEARYHIAVIVVVQHLATVAEDKGTVAVYVNGVITKAAEHDKAFLGHIRTGSSHGVVALASVDHQLVVLAILVAVDIDRVATFAAVHHGKGLESVLAVNGLVDIHRVRARTQVVFPVFHVASVDTVLVGCRLVLVGKAERLGVRIEPFRVGLFLHIGQGIENNRRTASHRNHGLVDGPDRFQRLKVVLHARLGIAHVVGENTVHALALVKLRCGLGSRGPGGKVFGGCRIFLVVGCRRRRSSTTEHRGADIAKAELLAHAVFVQGALDIFNRVVLHVLRDFFLGDILEGIFLVINRHLRVNDGAVHRLE